VQGDRLSGCPVLTDKFKTQRRSTSREVCSARWVRYPPLAKKPGVLVSILPKGKPQRSLGQDSGKNSTQPDHSALESIVDFGCVEGQIVGFILRNLSRPIIVFGWEVEGIEPDRQHERCARRLRPRRCLAVASKKPALCLGVRSLKVMLRSLGAELSLGIQAMA
jgi:hypothetical protein